MSNSKLTKSFVLPKLKPDGSNWIMFMDAVQLESASHNLEGHLDGSKTRPVPPAVAPTTTTTATTGTSTTTTTPTAPTAQEQYERALDKWTSGEATIRRGLSEALPPALYLVVRKETSVKDVWAAIKHHHQDKAQLIIIELHTRLQNEKCNEKGDIRTHLAKLRQMLEDLALMGEVISDDNFRSIILASLPNSFDPFLTSLTNQLSPSPITVRVAAMTIGTTTIPEHDVVVTPPKISPDKLIETLNQESDRRAMRAGGSKKEKEKEDAAFTASSSTSGGKKGGKSTLRCFNCGKLGHKKIDCWAKGGGKEGQGPKQGKGKKPDTAAAAKPEEDIGAWTAILVDTEDVVSDGSADLSSAEEDLYKELFEDQDFWFMEDEDDVPHLKTPSDSSDDEMDLDDDMPALQTASDSSDSESDSDSNYEFVPRSDSELEYCDIPLDEPSEQADGLDDNVLAGFDNVLAGFDNDNDAYTTFSYAMISNEGGAPLTETELYDSGASRHMSPFRDRFINFTEIAPKSISAADQTSFKAVGKGDMYIELPNESATTKILLKDVLYAPSMALTLVSVSQIAAAGYTALFRKEHCQIFDTKRKLVGKISVDNGLYRVYHEARPSGTAATATERMSIMDLHRRMGHISYDAARDLVKKGLIKGIELDETSQPGPCESCEYAKMTRKPIQKVRVEPRAEKFGDEVHSDLWGPSPVKSIGGREYYVTYTDGCTRWTVVDILKTKDQTFDSYKDFEAWAKTQYGVNVKCLFSDRGGEYMSGEFKAHLSRQGTKRRLTVHDTPEYNGIAERLNRTILEKVRAILHASALPKFLWAEAVTHAVYLKNRTSTRALDNKTPYEMLYDNKPDLAHLPEWGVKVWVHDNTGTKLDARSQVGYWVGYEEASNAHRIYWPGKRTVSVERSVKFDIQDVRVDRTVPLEGEQSTVERPAVVATHPSAPAPTPAAPSSATTTAEKTSSAPDPLGQNFENVPDSEGGRGKRTRKPSEYIQRLRAGEGSTEGRPKAPAVPKGIRVRIPEEADQGEREAASVAIGAAEHAMAAEAAHIEAVDPTYEEVRGGPDWSRWRQAIEAELESLRQAGTWTVVERPKDANVVDSKWVLRIKKDSLGQIEKYKARLVAKGFTQVYGQDYFETFAPVARLASIRTILAIAARNDWPIDSFDFHSAYLNGELGEDEIVFMEQPPDFETVDRRRFVLRLFKALYGLKQGGRKWYEALCKLLAELGFQRSEADRAIFFLHEQGIIIVLAIHVDDCAITGNSVERIAKVKRQLNEKFKLTDLGSLTWLLGIAVTRDRHNRTLSLSQQSYIDSILIRSNLGDLSPRAMPMDPTLMLSKAQCPTTADEIAYMRKVPYRQCLGMLMWADVGTRPDIAFAVSMLSQFSSNPGKAHWEALKHVFRYLKGTKTWKLTYGGEEHGLEGYSDADGSSQEHRHAISGYAFLIDGGAVSWAAKRQEIVALSTTEAEYVATTHAAKEAVWLRRLIGEAFRPLIDPTPLYCDNQSAIALTKDGQYHARTKHIDIRYHFIRFVIDNGTVKLIYCPTDEMVADTLTKALPSAKGKHFASALGLSAD